MIAETAIKRGESKSYIANYNLNTLNDHKKALILVCCMSFTIGLSLTVVQGPPKDVDSGTQQNPGHCKRSISNHWQHSCMQTETTAIYLSLLDP